MSDRFGIVPDAVVLNSPLPLAAIRTYVAFAIYANSETREVWVSREKLARELGIQTRSLRADIKLLVKAGWLTRLSGGGGGKNALFRVNKAPQQGAENGSLGGKNRSIRGHSECPLDDLGDTSHAPLGGTSHAPLTEEEQKRGGKPLARKREPLESDLELTPEREAWAANEFPSLPVVKSHAKWVRYVRRAGVTSCDWEEEFKHGMTKEAEFYEKDRPADYGLTESYL